MVFLSINVSVDLADKMAFAAAVVVAEAVMRANVMLVGPVDYVILQLMFAVVNRARIVVTVVRTVISGVLILPVETSTSVSVQMHSAAPTAN